MIFDDEETHCPFIADWQKQTSANANCNLLHEVGIRVGDSGLKDRLEHLDSGGFKDVFSVWNEDDTPTGFVLKTTFVDGDFRGRDLYKHQRDAMIMDEATASPYVLDMYGYCGHSGLVERATGTMKQWMRDHREEAEPLILLQIAVMVALGVRDMHLFHNGMATVAHADVKVQQFLLIPSNDGSVQFKINDFNRCALLTSKNPPEVCPFFMGNTHKGSTSRAPEEYTDDAPQTDKIDVFSMGAVFYYILTGYAPFNDVSFKRAIKKITSGIQPPLPKSIQNSTDPSIVAIVDSMNKCRQFHAKDRPSSREVAKELTEAYDKIIG
jgi:serine/threonine protein kinase